MTLPRRASLACGIRVFGCMLGSPLSVWPIKTLFMLTAFGTALHFQVLLTGHATKQALLPNGPNPNPDLPPAQGAV